MSRPAPSRSEIFERVLAAAPDARPAVLEELCGEQADLRREMEALVATAERALSTASLRRSLSDEPEPLAAGTRVGPYVVEREMDRGGMSIIYLARDAVLDRPAVLKASRFSRDPRFRTRLEQEARLAARLSGHPNIAVTYGLVERDEDLYIAQEFVGGTTLREALARGPLGEREAVGAARAIASAMAAAHAAGVIHRDLKPENIMRLPSGAYKVLDFGIAKLDAAALETTLEQRLTLPGEAIGTPGYASPEQLLGHPVDRRSDIYSFGIVFYEMLTGRHPFGDHARFAAAFEDAAPALTTAAGTVRPEVLRVVARCLRKAPSERYDSAPELERALQALETGATSETIQPPRTRAVGWWQFHLVAASAANALVILALWQARGWWPTWKPFPALPDLALVLLFFLPLALACVIGVLRLNLAFGIGQHPTRVEGHYTRVRPWLLAADLAFAGLTGLTGVLIAADHASWATLLIACAVSIGAVAAVIEPGTAEEAIGAARRRTGVLHDR